MSEDQKIKSGWFRRFLLLAVKSPVSTALALFLAYFALKAYVFGGGFTDEAAVFGIIGLWMFWFIARHLLLLLALVVLLGGGAWWYCSYARRAETACEESGGVWNRENKTCEEKSGFWAELQKMWREYRAEK